MKQIDKLSKDELLSLIYNNFEGKTLFNVHPCECASCGQKKVEEGGYYYICDRCNNITDTPAWGKLLLGTVIWLVCTYFVFGKFIDAWTEYFRSTR